MSPCAHCLRLIPGRISGATTSKAATVSVRLTAWFTKTSIERVIAARSAGLKRGEAAAGAASASATTPTRTSLMGER
jgi:hypothetical protein